MPRSAFTALTLLLIVGGIALRVHDLGAGCFGHDEVDRLRAWEATPGHVEPADASVPVSLFGGWVRSLGYDERSLRLPGAFAGSLTVAVLWGLARSTHGPLAAAFASAGFAWSAMQIGAARQLGPVVWETWLMVFSGWAFWWATGGKHRPWRWLAFIGAAATCALQTQAAACLLAALGLAGLSVVIRGRQAAGAASVLPLAAPLVLLGVNLWKFGPLPPRTFFQGPLAWEGYLRLVDVFPTTLVLVLVPLVIIGIAASLQRAPGLFPLLWLAASVTAWLVARAEWRASLAYAHAVEPAIWVLAGAGLAVLCRRCGEHLGGRAAATAGVLALVLVVLLEAESALAVVRRAAPDWRQIAEIVRRNWRTGEAVVVLHDRESFVFYAPDLERRVLPQLGPVRAMTAFTNVRRGWLVASAGAHYYPGWGAVEAWIQRFAAVELSPDPAAVNVYYVGRNGRDELLVRAGFFDLPAASLMQGTLMMDVLRKVETSNVGLWKIDQLALAPGQPALRNASLLEAVSLLAERRQGDRAASLAYRLATAAPDWREAQEVLAAFSPAPPPQ